MRTINLKLDLIIFEDKACIFRYGWLSSQPIKHANNELLENSSFNFIKELLLYALNKVRVIPLVSNYELYIGVL